MNWAASMDIVQVSDFHCVADGERAYGRVDTQAMLARAVAAVNGLRPRPDLVIATGDLVQAGRAEEYAALRSILSALEIPLAPCLGNHDARGAFKAAFADLGLAFGPEPFVQYVIEADALRIVVLDTVTEGSDAASFCEARAAWLQARLTGAARPTLIVTHHPPFMTGVPWMDPARLDWTQGLARVLGDHQHQIVGVISGHIHRAIHGWFGAIPASTCPSTAHQVAFDLTAARPALSLEAPGFQRHLWTDGRIITHTASFEGLEAVFSPVSAEGGR